jgi:hypothetical protein
MLYQLSEASWQVAANGSIEKITLAVKQKGTKNYA